MENNKTTENFKLRQVYEEILKLRDECEKDTTCGDEFMYEYACYTKCLHIIGNYME